MEEDKSKVEVGVAVDKYATAKEKRAIKKILEDFGFKVKGNIKIVPEEEKIIWD